MRSALLQLGEDFLSTIIFLVLFLATGHLVLAVACALAVGLGQVALLRWRARPVDLMQARRPPVSGYAWAALMFALGLTNRYVAATFSFAAWAWFISVGAVGAKVAAFFLQVGVLRMLVRRRMRATTS